MCTRFLTRYNFFFSLPEAFPIYAEVKSIKTTSLDVDDIKKDKSWINQLFLYDDDNHLSYRRLTWWYFD